MKKVEYLVTIEVNFKKSDLRYRDRVMDEYRRNFPNEEFFETSHGFSFDYLDHYIEDDEEVVDMNDDEWID